MADLDGHVSKPVLVKGCNMPLHNVSEHKLSLYPSRELPGLQST